MWTSPLTVRDHPATVGFWTIASGKSAIWRPRVLNSGQAAQSVFRQLDSLPQCEPDHGRQKTILKYSVTSHSHWLTIGFVKSFVAAIFQVSSHLILLGPTFLILTNNSHRKQSWWPILNRSLDGWDWYQIRSKISARGGWSISWPSMPMRRLNRDCQPRTSQWMFVCLGNNLEYNQGISNQENNIKMKNICISGVNQLGISLGKFISTLFWGCRIWDKPPDDSNHRFRPVWGIWAWHCFSHCAGARGAVDDLAQIILPFDQLHFSPLFSACTIHAQKIGRFICEVLLNFHSRLEHGNWIAADAQIRIGDQNFVLHSLEMKPHSSLLNLNFSLSYWFFLSVRILLIWTRNSLLQRLSFCVTLIEWSMSSGFLAEVRKNGFKGEFFNLREENIQLDLKRICLVIRKMPEIKLWSTDWKTPDQNLTNESNFGIVRSNRAFFDMKPNFSHISSNFLVSIWIVWYRPKTTGS